jgi:prepilin-type N-terminal cleavage/methylation domain-containing protein
MLKPNHPKGFSLVELTVVSTLMSLLALLLSSAWFGVGRTAADLIGRSRLVQERDLAVAALSRDLGGCLVNPAAEPGEKINGRWLMWLPQELPPTQELKLYYDGGTVVHYLVESGLLKRKIVGTSTDFIVANNVHSMTVTPEPANKAINIVLCFKYRTRTTLTCNLTAKQPSVPSALPLPWSIYHYTNP